MSTAYLSIRTRNAVRDVLAQRGPLDVSDLCSECEIRRQLETIYPRIDDERTRLAAEYLASLNLNMKRDAERLLALVARLAEEPVRGRHFSQLQQALERDGFMLESSSLVAKSPFALVVFPKYAPVDSVTGATRERICSDLQKNSLAVEGRFTFQRLLDRFIATPVTHGSLGVGLMQAYVNSGQSSLKSYLSGFGGRPIDWPDGAFLRILVESLHPDVRSLHESNKLLRLYNSQLESDGWEIVKAERVEGADPFVFRRRSIGGVTFPDSTPASDILSGEYVRDLVGKCDSRLTSGDLEGTITTARTMLEAVLRELEIQLAGAPGDYKGDLPRQFKAVVKQLRIDDERRDLDDNFKQVARGLVQVVNGLAPIRNKMSDGHARERKPEIHEARVVLNASKTVAAFLVDCYLTQKEQGELSTPTPSHNDDERASGGST
ncbi:MAG: abortive infection family protein [Polyangiaceae bacterium]|nr:abortive infection family protein [Polyangiaceae bacterium]